MSSLLIRSARGSSISIATTFQSVASSCHHVSHNSPKTKSPLSNTHINHGKTAQNLDGLDLADMARRQAANLKDVHRVVVAREAGELVGVVGIFPCLGDGAVVEGVGLVRPDALYEARLLALVVVEDGVFVSPSQPSYLTLL